MNRYQILIEYVGTNYRGWQIQKKGPTIQGLIQEKLSKLLKEKIVLHGQGRTDAGVHAFEQSAHFDCKNKITDKIKFLKSINHFLNLKDIAIKNIKKKNNKFHARFSDGYADTTIGTTGSCCTYRRYCSRTRDILGKYEYWWT